MQQTAGRRFPPRASISLRLHDQFLGQCKKRAHFPW